MNDHITRIQQNIEPLRQQIIQHQVYSVIKDITDLQVFMKYHVYAVWDFMSLLKSLQNSLTCTSVPWFPTGDGETRHLINEIVTGEESDVDMDGAVKSHFELYLDAMAQCGADVGEINRFINVLRETGDFDKAFDAAGTPQKAREFVGFTFDTIATGKAHLQAATFTFGREDLIPGMFMSIIEDIHRHFPDSISIFKYYLERHIEVDGDHHSHLALQMTANLCGDNEAFWQEAEKATIASLERRIALWDGVYEEIEKVLK
ncbi:hypothetical protein GCM10010967_46360 [Dyadobacter beijingensis]|uniref:DUF3050 domain-containing protein n=1 Tax=Dyadobacter beijingensis TaxID=365489 RepID=A0ABQ2IB86_9BACT|nr:DUF3050 domain-containing protein [Dyadobacter beijingensis]GGN05888.1 hypothetical protein GCM10010967_46360 [Dyadobacter beijingensis]